MFVKQLFVLFLYHGIHDIHLHTKISKVDICETYIFPVNSQMKISITCTLLIARNVDMLASYNNMQLGSAFIHFWIYCTHLRKSRKHYFALKTIFLSYILLIFERGIFQCIGFLQIYSFNTTTIIVCLSCLMQA